MGNTHTTTSKWSNSHHRGTGHSWAGVGAGGLQRESRRSRVDALQSASRQGHSHRLNAPSPSSSSSSAAVVSGVHVSIVWSLGLKRRQEGRLWGDGRLRRAAANPPPGTPLHWSVRHLCDASLGGLHGPAASNSTKSSAGKVKEGPPLALVEAPLGLAQGPTSGAADQRGSGAGWGGGEEPPEASILLAIARVPSHLLPNQRGGG